MISDSDSVSGPTTNVLPNPIPFPAQKFFRLQFIDRFQYKKMLLPFPTKNLFRVDH